MLRVAGLSTLLIFVSSCKACSTVCFCCKVFKCLSKYVWKLLHHRNCQIGFRALRFDFVKGYAARFQTVPSLDKKAPNRSPWCSMLMWRRLLGIRSGSWVSVCCGRELERRCQFATWTKLSVRVMVGCYNVTQAFLSYHKLSHKLSCVTWCDARWLQVAAHWEAPWLCPRVSRRHGRLWLPVPWRHFVTSNTSSNC